MSLSLAASACMDSNPSFFKADSGQMLHRIHSLILDISIAPLQVNYYSEATQTEHGYCVGVLRRSATGNCG